MNYNLGLCSVSFRKNTPAEILHAMKDVGLSFIEWGSDVHCPVEKATEIAALQQKYGIACSSYGTYFRLGITPLAELEAYIHAARLLGTSVLRVWCGDKNSEDYTEAETAALFTHCKAAAEIARQHGVTLCMECHNKTYTNTKESALKLMEAISSPHFRMYWQPNQLRTEEENIAYANLLSPYTVHIHVFNWKGKQKFPLRNAVSLWKRYLAPFDRRQTLLLEFMPDGRIETLQDEACALQEIVK